MPMVELIEIDSVPINVFLNQAEKLTRSYNENIILKFGECITGEVQ